MRPTLIRIEDVAALPNLHRAFWRCAKGHRHQAEVQDYARDLDRRLADLGRGLLEGSASVGAFRVFRIHDPKPRTIHAPPFAERVLQHALMGLVAPVLERALVDDSFACRPGKGSRAAVQRAQQLLRRWPFYVKVDVRRYFDSIDHGVLLALLRRRIRGTAVVRWFERIVASHSTASGKGLPIGALTSQYLANLYLGPFDRWLAEHPAVHGTVRYMDDVTWWCADRAAATTTLTEARVWLHANLRLELKQSVQLQPSARGLTLCGFRILPHVLRLSARRRRRYARARAAWEDAYRRGALSAAELQRGVAAALAITAHASAAAWRRSQLQRRPPPDA